MATLTRKWRGGGSGEGSHTCLVFTMPLQLGGVWNRYPCLFPLVNTTSALPVGKLFGALENAIVCDCLLVSIQQDALVERGLAARSSLQAGNSPCHQESHSLRGLSCSVWEAICI